MCYTYTMEYPSDISKYLIIEFAVEYMEWKHLVKYNHICYSAFILTENPVIKSTAQYMIILNIIHRGSLCVYGEIHFLCLLVFLLWRAFLDLNLMVKCLLRCVIFLAFLLCNVGEQRKIVWNQLPNYILFCIDLMSDEYPSKMYKQI